MNFRECGECTECCNGNLELEVHGNYVGKSKPCPFLGENNCGIYEKRPNTCASYQCAWTQYILPETMRPDQCGVLVSVEFDQNQKQFLRVIELREFIEYNTYHCIDKFTKQHDTYWIKVPFVKKIETVSL